MKEFWDLAKTIIASPAGLVALIGLLLLGLGAAGGIRYEQWFVIDDPFWRPALAGLGLLMLVAAAIKLLFYSSRAIIDAVDFRKLGIKIVRPSDNETVAKKVRVTITSEKPIPPGYHLRVLRGYPREDGILPNARLQKDLTKLEWNAHDFDLGGSVNEVRTIEACVVGPDGLALLGAWERDHEVHVKTINELNRVAEIAKVVPKIDWLKSIVARTADMHLCASITVTRGPQASDATNSH